MHNELNCTAARQKTKKHTRAAVALDRGFIAYDAGVNVHSHARRKLIMSERKERNPNQFTACA